MLLGKTAKKKKKKNDLQCHHLNLLLTTYEHPEILIASFWLQIMFLKLTENFLNKQ